MNKCFRSGSRNSARTRNRNWWAAGRNGRGLQATASQTALRVAIQRALHQVYDAPPLVLADPIAIPILGTTYRSALEEAATSVNDRFSRVLRAGLIARNRYAEDQLAEAVGRGVSQYVMLGAGLDTFAYRNPYPNLRVFEVDHPATQVWKRHLLDVHGISRPERLHYVPVDFERQSLRSQLQEGGLDWAAPAVFAWLGVVMYLTTRAFRATLDTVASFPKGSGVVLDYALPRRALSPYEAEVRDRLATRVTALGEPFQLFFTPDEIAAELTAFSVLEDLNSEELHIRYFMNRPDRLSLAGRSGHLLGAWL